MNWYEATVSPIPNHPQVGRLGMGKAIGNLAFKPGNAEDFQEKPYSEATSTKIDLEVRELVSQVRSFVVRGFNGFRPKKRQLSY